MSFLHVQCKVNPQLTHNNSTIDKLKGGESADYALVAEEWPTFLYDEESGWNIKDIRRGLFRGHILARVSSIHLYHTSPEPEGDPPYSGRSTNVPQQDSSQKRDCHWSIHD